MKTASKIKLKPVKKSAPKALLTIELVPESCWMSNVRSCVSETEWDRLRKAQARLAGYVCEICGGVGPKWPVECHEIWHYDDKKKIQILKGLISLCPACHEVKHMGRAAATGRGEQAARHLSDINGWSESETVKYIQAQFDMWRKRTEFEWKLELSYLSSLGVDMKFLKLERH